MTANDAFNRIDLSDAAVALIRAAENGLNQESHRMIVSAGAHF